MIDEKEMNALLAENAQLRKERDETFKQYKQWLEAADANWITIRNERDKAINERDEVRKLFCQLLHSVFGSRVSCEKLAQDHGWDCYKEETP